MGLTLADTYYLRAKAAGRYSDWEEVCETLNYALSYDEKHCAALCLLGEIYAKQLSMYKEAFECFDKVIALDNTYVEVYYLYGKYLIWNNNIARAQKLIVYAFTIEGIDKAELYWLMAYSLEVKQYYATALKMLRKAQIETYNESHTYFLEKEVKRIKKKMKLKRPKKQKKKKN